MAKFGYARVSTTDQDLSIQEAALRAAGCELIRAEKRAARAARPRGAGDRARFPARGRRADGHPHRSARAQHRRPAGHRARRTGPRRVLRATEQPIDTGTAAGKCFLDMLGVFAEFETNLRRERQLEGIAKAKAAGVYKGGRRLVPDDEVKRLHAAGRSKTEIAEELDISRQSVYRALGR